MKSMTKLIVVAMLLAAALVVTPVAAGTRTIEANGANVFIGEENITLMGDFAGATQLVHYTGEVNKSATDKSIPVTSGFGGVVIDEVLKGIPVGSYYVNGSDSLYVNVQIPEVTLDVMLNTSPTSPTTPKDSVNGKSITRNTWLDFKFFSNVDLAGGNMTASGNTTNVELTLPGGGVVTDYNNTPLTFNANGKTQYIPVFFGPNAEAGTYTAVAKWARASDFFGKGYDSKPVTFEVLTKALGITANKDSVIRGNSFTVTITGDARTDYTLSIKGADPNDPTKSPMIAPSQTAFSKNTGAIIGETNATITTNAGGTATIQFNTTKNTEAKTFTIKVNDTTKSDEVKVKVEKGSVTITTSGPAPTTSVRRSPFPAPALKVIQSTSS